MTDPHAEATWARLREAQDALDDAKPLDPKTKAMGGCGSEQMAVEELAGNALPLLLAVVEAAACYREAQKTMGRNPALGKAHVLRTRKWLDEALGELDD